MKRAAPAVFSAGCVLFLAAQALATPTAQLSYARAEGAESCPDTLEVRKAISQRLGYDPVDPNSTQIMAAIVEKTPTGFRARVELIAGGGSQGLRELSSSGSCAELVSAMALSMSIAIDPERAEQSQAASAALSGSGPVEPANGEQAPLPAQPVVSALPAPPVAPPPRPPVLPRPSAAESDEKAPASSSAGLNLPIDYSVGALIELASGFAPGIGAGGSLRVRGRHGWFSLSLEGRVDAPSTGSQPSAEARVWGGLVAVVVAPCVHYGPAFGCALLLGGEVWASSSGVSDPDSDLSLYSALGARLGLDWPEHGVWAVALHADALRPLTRISIRLDEKTAWTAPELALVAGAGVVVRF